MRLLRQKPSTGFKPALCLGACLAVGVLSAPALAQTASTPDPQAAQSDEIQIDVDALFEQAMQAEWEGRYAQARTLHTQAAQADHPRANYQLGFLLLDGLGGPRDVAAAREALRSAADLGVTIALVPYLYSYDTQDDPEQTPDAQIASHALLELALRDLGMAGDTIQFWSQPLRRQVQVDLKEAGFYRGAIDGLIGQGSLNALRQFARRRAPLPELPVQSFDQILLTANGVTADDRPTFAWSQIESVIDIRSAFAGTWVDSLPGDLWRIGVDSAALIDLPQQVGEMSSVRAYLPVADASPGPRRTLRFGMTPGGVGRGDIGMCARTPVDANLRYTNRCQTRVAGVHLIFEAQLEQDTALQGEASDNAASPTERLVAIELSPPPQLRLTQTASDQ